MIATPQSVNSAGFDESPMARFLLRWSAELAGAVVGSMLCSDFDQYLLGALIGLGVTAAVHFSWDPGTLPGEPAANADS